MMKGNKKGAQGVAQWTVHVDKTEWAQFFAIYILVHIVLWTSHCEYYLLIVYIPYIVVFSLELVFLKLIFLSGYYSTI